MNGFKLSGSSKVTTNKIVNILTVDADERTLSTGYFRVIEIDFAIIGIIRFA